MDTNDLGQPIKRYCTDWQLTQEQLAGRLRVDPRQIRRWQNEGVKPRAKNRQKLDPCLKAREDTMKRRDFLRMAVDISLTFPAFCQPSNPSQLRERLVDSLSFEEEFSIIEVLIKTCWQLLPHHANVVESRYLDYVCRYQSMLENWLKSSPGSPVDLRLLSYMSELLQVEGWLRFALGSPDDAETAYQVALQRAEQAGNLRMQALALTWHSNLLIDAGREHSFHDRSTASGLAEEARKRAKNADWSPLMYAWIVATIADAWAHKHEEHKAVYQCEKALGDAAELMSSVAFEQDSHPAVPYDKIWSSGFEGAVYTQLGRPKEAQIALNQGLTSLDPASYRRWGFHKDLIIAYGREENIEAACRSARSAWDLAQQTNALMELRRTRDAVQQTLGRWKEYPAVKDLMEEFREAQ